MITTYNVHSCRNSRGALSIEETAAVMASTESDVICAQELDFQCTRSEMVHQSVELATRLGKAHADFKVVDWKKQKRTESEGYFGLTTLYDPNCSPKIERRVLPLTRSLDEPRGVLITIFTHLKKTIAILNTHLSTDRKNQLIQQQAIADMIEEFSKHTDFVILAGDLNAPRVARLKKQFNTLKEVVPKQKLKTTFPARWPVMRLDRIFVPHNMNVLDCRITKSLASDHLPLSATLEIC